LLKNNNFLLKNNKNAALLLLSFLVVLKDVLMGAKIIINQYVTRFRGGQRGEF
jgi:hypothetical protein